MEKKNKKSILATSNDMTRDLTNKIDGMYPASEERTREFHLKRAFI